MTGLQPLFNMRPMPVAEAVEFGNKAGSTVFAMIESDEAVTNADEIAAVEGIDVLLVGSNDLSIDIGVPGDWKSQVYRSALEKVSDACHRNKKAFGVAGVYNDSEVHDWFINTLGARFLLVEQDLSLIAKGGRKAVGDVPKVRL
jgi:2-keto-3-deoxy-L-rhamnonate aldolase RhmA